MELDKFSQDFAEYFFRFFPELRNFARVEGPPESAEGCLVVELTPPAASKMDYSLCIETDTDEVTVFLEHYHRHFYWPPEESDPAEIDGDPVGLTRAILDEAAVVASWWNDAEWVGSAILRSNDPLKKPDYFAPASRVRVRSWNGTFSKDIVVRE